MGVIASPDVDLRTDEDLVALSNRGDEAAFEALYHRHRDWVVRLAYRFTGNDADALDVLQETFAYVLSKLPSLRLTARMTTFLYPVVRSLSIAARRKRGRSLGGGPIGSEPAARVEGGSREDLETVLAGLPEGHREAILLRFVDGLSQEEVAEALGIPVGTVKSRIHNAIETLRNDPRARRHFRNP